MTRWRTQHSQHQHELLTGTVSLDRFRLFLVLFHYFSVFGSVQQIKINHTQKAL